MRKPEEEYHSNVNESASINVLLDKVTVNPCLHTSISNKIPVGDADAHVKELWCNLGFTGLSILIVLKRNGPRAYCSATTLIPSHCCCHTFAPPDRVLLYPPTTEPGCRYFGKRLVAVDIFVSLQIIRKASGAVQIRTHSIHPAIGYLVSIDTGPATGHRWPILYARVVLPFSKTPGADGADAGHLITSITRSADNGDVTGKGAAPESRMGVAIAPHVIHDGEALVIQGPRGRPTSLGFLPLDVFLPAGLC